MHGPDSPASGFGEQATNREEAKKEMGRKRRERARLEELADIVNKYGKPWYTKMGSDKGDFEASNEDWYEQY